VDPDIEIVICTAYSDHPWEDIGRRIGNTDKLLILMKPFNSIEVVQLANSLTKKWDVAHVVKRQLEDLARTVSQRTEELRDANLRFQENFSRRMTETAANQPQNGDAAELHQKEEFLAIMSHETLTPMTELVGTAGRLLDSALNPEQQQQVVTIQRCAQDLLALLKDMHEYMAGHGHAMGKNAIGDGGRTSAEAV
jgi:signal transduction histidine kinase